MPTTTVGLDMTTVSDAVAVIADDSLAAPMLVHLAVNEAGAVAALVVQRIGSGHGERQSS